MCAKWEPTFECRENISIRNSLPNAGCLWWVCWRAHCASLSRKTQAWAGKVTGTIFGTQLVLFARTSLKLETRNLSSHLANHHAGKWEVRSHHLATFAIECMLGAMPIPPFSRNEGKPSWMSVWLRRRDGKKSQDMDKETNCGFLSWRLQENFPSFAEVCREWEWSCTEVSKGHKRAHFKN